MRVGTTNVSESFSVSMEILAHPFNHNGVLFAVGWKPDINLTSIVTGEQEQYLLFEFIHSSVRLYPICPYYAV